MTVLCIVEDIWTHRILPYMQPQDRKRLRQTCSSLNGIGPGPGATLVLRDVYTTLAKKTPSWASDMTCVSGCPGSLTEHLLAAAPRKATRLLLGAHCLPICRDCRNDRLDAVFALARRHMPMLRDIVLHKPLRVSAQHLMALGPPGGPEEPTALPDWVLRDAHPRLSWAADGWFHFRVDIGQEKLQLTPWSVFEFFAGASCRKVRAYVRGDSARQMAPYFERCLEDPGWVDVFYDVAQNAPDDPEPPLTSYSAATRPRPAPRNAGLLISYDDTLPCMLAWAGGFTDTLRALQIDLNDATSDIWEVLGHALAHALPNLELLCLVVTEETLLYTMHAHTRACREHISTPCNRITQIVVVAKRCTGDMLTRLCVQFLNDIAKTVAPLAELLIRCDQIS